MSGVARLGDFSQDERFFASNVENLTRIQNDIIKILFYALILYESSNT